jgi:hypothetical protein
LDLFIVSNLNMNRSAKSLNPSQEDEVLAHNTLK